jgi:hypothetical protein
LSTYGGRPPEGQAGAGTAAAGRQAAAGGVVDLSGFSLRELRDLGDAEGKSYLGMALRRILASEEPPGLHGFQSKI